MRNWDSKKSCNSPKLIQLVSEGCGLKSFLNTHTTYLPPFTKSHKEIDINEENNPRPKVTLF